jgi:hypothetical protein
MSVKKLVAQERNRFLKSDTTLDAIRLNSGDWRWSVEVDRRKCGTCATEAEAKSAAIAAARGL